MRIAASLILSFALVVLFSRGAGAPVSAKMRFGSLGVAITHSSHQRSDAQSGPSKQYIQGQEATGKAPSLPGVVFVESIPSAPIPQAADPYAFINAQQLAKKHNNHNALPAKTRPAHLRFRSVNAGSPSPTGLNNWWTYDGDTVPGVGNYYVNVGNSNLVIQATDMYISHKGVDLSFRRTYNSQSQHDYENTDGSIVNNYGEGWTNTFDAHIAFNNLTGPGISVYDGNGARYDYSKVCNPTCSFVPPPGQSAMLTLDPSSGKYYWTKKSGLVYLFHSPNDSTPGVAGRVSAIWARNEYLKLLFAYSFDSGYNDSDHLNEITVDTESTNGSKIEITLTFNDYFFPNNPSPHRLLASLNWPIGNGGGVVYKYDTSGRLIEVDERSNSSGGATNPQWYTWYSSGYLLESANGGRWATSNGSDGAYLHFDYFGTALTDVQYYGWANPTVTDSSGSGPVQPSIPSNYGTVAGAPYKFLTFSSANLGSPPSPAPEPSPAGSDACSSGLSSIAQYDSDGHEVYYCYDSTGRVVQSDTWDGSVWENVESVWDANNDKTEITDQRQGVTDYQYDQWGNLLTIAMPETSVVTANGTIEDRPTATYAYDGSNNLVSYCDAVWEHSNSGDWPSPKPCPSPSSGSSGPAYYSWSPPQSGMEPMGELVQTTSPTGYQVNYYYSPSPQGGEDYGLPSEVKGTTFTELDSNRTQITPDTTYTYDNFGNVVCVNNGIGVWVYKYDALNRLVAKGDPDDASLSAPCSKTPGLLGSSLASDYSYYPNNQLESSQSSAERAYNVSSSFSYDADGDEVSDVHYFGNNDTSGATTEKWYDGADRLVEVSQPHDATDYYTFPWMTRYFYDLAHQQSDVVYTPSGSQFTSFQGFGNLYDIQEYLPDSLTQGENPYSGSAQWTTMKATAYDPMNRMITSYDDSQQIPNGREVAYASTGSDEGLVSTETSILGNAEALSYDGRQRISELQFSGPGQANSPTLTIGYDLDGRIATITSAAFGTESYNYDADGNLESVTEPAGGSGLSGYPGSGNLTGSSTITYSYYPNGWRSSVSVTSSSFTLTNLLEYVYQEDGARTQILFSYKGFNGTFSSSYTAGDRIETRSDPVINDSEIRQYNNYGQVANIQIDAGQYSSMSYDPEDELVTAIASPNPQFSPLPLNYTYTDRGESVGNPVTQGGTDIANGFPYWIPRPGLTISFNALNKQWIGGPDYTIAGGQDNNCNVGNHNPPATVVNSRNYDTDGRVQYVYYTLTYNGQGWRCPVPDDVATTGGYLYDNLNHITGQTAVEKLTTQSGATSYVYGEALYGWGPNGHPIISGTANGSSPSRPTFPLSSYTNHTLHWDGDQLLFTTNASGQIDDIKIEDLADYLPLDSTHPGLVVWDRNLARSIVSSHFTIAGGSAFGDWDEVDPRWAHACAQTISIDSQGGGLGPTSLPPYGGCPGTKYVDVSALGTYLERVTGSYEDENNTFQGVRSEEPGSAGWLVPDASAGSIDQPSSIERYSYENNNAQALADPLGLFIIDKGKMDNTFIQGLEEDQEAISDLEDTLWIYEERTTIGGWAPNMFVQAWVDQEDDMLQMLSADLTPGWGNWHITIDDSSTLHEDVTPSGTTEPNATSSFDILSASKVSNFHTTFWMADIYQLGGPTAMADSLLEECGAYEMSTGRAFAGSAGLFVDAYDAEGEAGIDRLIQKYYGDLIAGHQIDDD